jgi:hypothetical protein
MSQPKKGEKVTISREEFKKLDETWAAIAGLRYFFHYMNETQGDGVEDILILVMRPMNQVMEELGLRFQEAEKEAE